MNQGHSVETHQSSIDISLKRKELYSPVAIAVYSILTSFLVGLILYGINLTRRSEIWMGRVLITLAGIVSVCLIVAGILGRSVHIGGLQLMSVLVGIGLFQIEKGPFKRAIIHGAVKARWWPPFLWVLLVLIIYVITLIIIGPAKETM